MAQQGGVMPGSGTPGSLSWVPLVVSALVVAHVCALHRLLMVSGGITGMLSKLKRVFWIYKLATDKPEDRRKVH